MANGADVDFSYDGAKDVFTIYGVRYSGALFRTLGFDNVGTWIRLGARRDGVIELFTVSPDVKEQFDAIVKMAASG